MNNCSLFSFSESRDLCGFCYLGFAGSCDKFHRASSAFGILSLMSLFPLCGLVLRLFLRVRGWSMVTMPPNCQLPGSNGKLSPNVKFNKKAKEPFNVPSCVRRWRRKLFYLWLVLIVAIGIIWFLAGFSGSSLVGEMKSSEICEEVLLEHLNVSENQLRGLPSPLSEWSQVPIYTFHSSLCDSSWTSVFFFFWVISKFSDELFLLFCSCFRWCLRWVKLFLLIFSSPSYRIKEAAQLKLWQPALFFFYQNHSLRLPEMKISHWLLIGEALGYLIRYSLFCPGFVNNPVPNNA